MKNCLDIFLSEHQMTRYELSKKTGISEQTLSRAGKRSPETYSAKTLMAIAEGVGKTPGAVLDDLLGIEKSDKLYTATTLNEIKQKVREQEDEFLVKGTFKELMREVKRSTLSETEQMGAQIGSGAAVSTEAWFITRFFNLFAKDRKLENLKQNIGEMYSIQILDNNTAKLRLKILDY